MMKVSNAWRASMRRVGILGILATSATLLLSSFAVLGTSTVASAGLTTWGTVTLPHFAPDDSTHIAVDGAGNIYTIPSQGELGNCIISVYSPSSATTTYLDPSGSNFCGDYFAVTQSGTVYLINSSGTIIRVDPNGNESIYGSVPHHGPIAVDGSGNVYVASVNYPDTTIYKFTNGSGVVMGIFAGARLYSIAVGPDGSVYGVDYGNTTNLFHMTPSGSVSTVSGYLILAEGMTVDGAGNIFVADERNGIVEFSAAGPVANVAGYPGRCAEAAAIGGSTMYVYDECSGRNIYTYGVVSAPSPVLSLMVQSSIATINSENTQTVTASWTGSAYATSYTCTLMYGYTTPSSFTETTSATQCSFTGLDLSIPYGVQVVALAGSYSSLPVVAFPDSLSTPTTTVPVHRAKKTVIVCVNGHQVRWIAAIHPHCPLGFSRRP